MDDDGDLMILGDSPGMIGDPEIWIDESSLDVYATGDIAPLTTIDRPDGSWVGAVIHFNAYPDWRPAAVYRISSRRHSTHNGGRPYYVARWPD